MYRKQDHEQLAFEDFYLPFSGKLRSNNRWVRLAKEIPWAELEEEYASLFSSQMGAPAKSFRMALGALIIKERLAITDEETVEQICETPYLQYFIGLEEFQDTQPFDPSMMVHFRKRITPEILSAINERIVNKKLKKDSDDDSNSGNGSPTGSDAEPTEANNEGIMMVDATVAPADITYPTDLKLLNSSREILESIIDTLHAPHRGVFSKPRTYRKKARQAYLHTAKQKRVGRKAVRKAIRQQLQYIQRDISHIQVLCEVSDLSLLSSLQYRELLIIQELFRQQKEMYAGRSHSVPDRIVNIAQPHVRPIVRGKAGSAVEFGAKIVMSKSGGFHILEKISWDNFNEATSLQEQIENYRRRTGHYPEAVLADRLYRNRDNLRYCKEHGIRLSGPKLGRPGKKHKEDLKIDRADSAMRNAIEGGFGTAKRKYGMNRIMAKLQNTSETSIAMIVLVMNLEKMLRDICVFIKVQLKVILNRNNLKVIWAA
jgi:transposase, IS5 family